MRYSPGAKSETFIDAQEKGLPCRTISLHGAIATYEGRELLPHSALGRARSKLERVLKGKGWQWRSTQSYSLAFKKFEPDVVIAQYGPIGVLVKEACRLHAIPLIVYFRGYDAHVHEILKRYHEGYEELFRQAFALVAVSPTIKQRLIELGAEPNKIIYQSSGVDCDRFQRTDPSGNPPTLLAVGRLVDKKAPHLTLLAFHRAVQQQRDIRLRLIGDGPLAGVCRDLVGALGIGDSVDLLGARAHCDVVGEMQKSRAFLQHSVEALSGDSEGTPNAVMEASASGLPVVATRHAGIPDVVLHGHTGFLVEERDVPSMADYILRLTRDGALAAEMGRRGRVHVCQNFSRVRSHETLFNLVLSAARSRCSGGT